MAISPRSELVIETLVVFGRFGKQWVWDEITPDSGSVNDSGHGTFDSIDDAVADFFADEGVDLTKPVAPEDAHWSKPVLITPTDLQAEEYHIRRYKYGAPDPIQAVWDV